MRIVMPTVVKAAKSEDEEQEIELKTKPSASEVYTMSSSGASGSGGDSGTSGATSSLSSGGAYTVPVSSEYADLSGIIEEMYARKLELARAALEKAYNESVLNIDSTMASIAPMYESARNQSAAASELEKRNFAEWANAKGLNNGASAQNELARSVTLQGTLGTLNKSEAEDMAELEQEKIKAKNDLEYAIATASAENGIALAGDLYSESVRIQNAKAAEAKAAAQLAQEAAELQWKQELAAAELELEKELEAEAAKAAKAESILEWQYKYDKLAAEKQENALLSAAGGSSSSSGSASKSASTTSVGTSSVSGAVKAASASKSSTASGGSVTGSTSLYEDMLASGNPYTYLTTYHSKYGISSSAAATMEKIYGEYESWLSSSAGQAVKGGGAYTAEQYEKYYSILDKLVVNSASNGESPTSYIRRVESSVGKSFYSDMIGTVLYGQLVSEADSYYKAYKAMMGSGNASKWLSENGSKYSSELRKWLQGKIN